MQTRRPSPWGWEVAPLDMEPDGLVDGGEVCCHIVFRLRLCWGRKVGAGSLGLTAMLESNRGERLRIGTGSYDCVS